MLLQLQTPQLGLDMGLKQVTVPKPHLPPHQPMAQPDLPRQGMAQLVLGMVPARQRTVHQEAVRQRTAQPVLPRQGMAPALGLQPGQGMARLDLPRQGMGQQGLQHQGTAPPLQRRQAMAQHLLPNPAMEPRQRQLLHLPTELPPMLLPLHTEAATLAAPHQEGTPQAMALKLQQQPLLPPLGMRHRGHTPKPAQGTVGVVAMVKGGRHRAVMGGSPMQRPLALVLLLQLSLVLTVQVRAPRMGRAAMGALRSRYQLRLCPSATNSIQAICLVMPLAFGTSGFLVLYPFWDRFWDKILYRQ